MVEVKLLLKYMNDTIFDVEIDDFFGEAEIEVEKMTLRKEVVIEYLEKIVNLLKEVEVIG